MSVTCFEILNFNIYTRHSVQSADSPSLIQKIQDLLIPIPTEAKVCQTDLKLFQVNPSHFLCIQLQTIMFSYNCFKSIHCTF